MKQVPMRSEEGVKAEDIRDRQGGVMQQNRQKREAFQIQHCTHHQQAELGAVS